MTLSVNRSDPYSRGAPANQPTEPPSLTIAQRKALFDQSLQNDQKAKARHYDTAKTELSSYGHSTVADLSRQVEKELASDRDSRTKYIDTEDSRISDIPKTVIDNINYHEKLIKNLTNEIEKLNKELQTLKGNTDRAREIRAQIKSIEKEIQNFTPIPHSEGSDEDKEIPAPDIDPLNSEDSDSDGAETNFEDDEWDEIVEFHTPSTSPTNHPPEERASKEIPAQDIDSLNSKDSGSDGAETYFECDEWDEIVEFHTHSTPPTNHPTEERASSDIEFSESPRQTGAIDKAPSTSNGTRYLVGTLLTGLLLWNYKDVYTKPLEKIASNISWDDWKAFKFFKILGDIQMVLPSNFLLRTAISKHSNKPSPQALKIPIWGSRIFRTNSPLNSDQHAYNFFSNITSQNSFLPPTSNDLITLKPSPLSNPLKTSSQNFLANLFSGDFFKGLLYANLKASDAGQSSNALLSIAPPDWVNKGVSERPQICPIGNTSNSFYSIIPKTSKLKNTEALHMNLTSTSIPQILQSSATDSQAILDLKSSSLSNPLKTSSQNFLANLFSGDFFKGPLYANLKTTNTQPSSSALLAIAPPDWVNKGICERPQICPIGNTSNSFYSIIPKISKLKNTEALHMNLTSIPQILQSSATDSQAILDLESSSLSNPLKTSSQNFLANLFSGDFFKSPLYANLKTTNTQPSSSALLAIAPPDWVNKGICERPQICPIEEYGPNLLSNTAQTAASGSTVAKGLFESLPELDTTVKVVACSVLAIGALYAARVASIYAYNYFYPEKKEALQMEPKVPLEPILQKTEPQTTWQWFTTQLWEIGSFIYRLFASCFAKTEQSILNAVKTDW